MTDLFPALLSYLSIGAGVFGILAATIATWLRASRKAKITITVGSTKVVIDSKNLTTNDLSRIVELASSIENNAPPGGKNANPQ